MYIELHTASSFSFLEGASLPEDLIAEAARLGYPALALCDRDGVYGAPRFHKAATEAGVRPLVGCEISLDLAAAGTPAGFSEQSKVGTGTPAGPAHRFSPTHEGTACRAPTEIRENVAASPPIDNSTPQLLNESPVHDSRLTVLVENRRGYQTSAGC